MDYDVIVIGGGASGMMAAGRAGERGKRVLLLEKNAEQPPKTPTMYFHSIGRRSILLYEASQLVIGVFSRGAL